MATPAQHRAPSPLVLSASWESQAATIAGEDDLDEVIRRIRASGLATMLYLEAPSGCTLVVALGASESILSFIDPDGRTLHSLGTPGRAGHLTFSSYGLIDELLAEMAIPTADAIAAARAFVLDGARPSAVRWHS